LACTRLPQAFWPPLSADRERCNVEGRRQYRRL
jgi:hypothetical protein